MSVNEQDSVASLNGLRWFIAFLSLGGAVYANHFFVDDSILIRVSAIIVLVAMGLGIAATTTKGIAGLAFAKEAKIEARKVVWPTRAETVQTSLIILVAVILISLMLWGVDAVLVNIVSFLTVKGS